MVGMRRRENVFAFVFYLNNKIRNESSLFIIIIIITIIIIEDLCR